MAQEQPVVTDSDPCRILVLDANIMLRAVLGVRVRSLIEEYAEDVSLFIPSTRVAEVKDYLPSL